MTVTADQDTPRWGTPDQAPEPGTAPIDANVIVYAGTIALRRAGLINPSDSPQSTDIVVGLVSKQTDNRTGSFFGGAASATQVPIDRGTFILSHDGGVTEADCGVTIVYVKDAVTVTKTQSTRPKAGIVKAIVDSANSKIAVTLATTADLSF